VSAEIALLGRVLSLTSQPDCSIKEVGSAVALSPDLSSQVVKVANSALYGMAGRITTLDRAVVILGVDAVAGIASSLIVADKLRHPPIGALPGDALWLHSLETGLCAELVSRALGWSVGSQAYLTGLLHDLGIRELLTEHGETYGVLLEEAAAGTLDLLTEERARLGETHAERLRALTRAWAFPESLADALAAHHAPAEASGLAGTLASLVHAAHLIVGDPVGRFTDRDGTGDTAAALLALGLDEEDVVDIRLTLDERVKEMSAALAR
jgi:HD-like signal output (HDOD) protein